MTTKSKLLAGALGAATAVMSIPALAVEATGNLYGDLRASVDYSSVEGDVSSGLGMGDDTDFRDLNSYIGVKGETTAGSLTAFGAFETYVDRNDALLASTASRQVYAGVKGSFGTISYGEMFMAYAKTGLAIDPFYNTALANGFGGAAGSTGLPSAPPVLAATQTFSSFGLSPFLTGDNPAKINSGLGVVLPERVGGVKPNQLAYESPDMAGLVVNAVVFLDSADNGIAGGEEHDFGLGAAYTLGNFKAGVQAIQANDETGTPAFNGDGTVGFDSVATRVHLSYTTASLGLGLSAERIDDKTDGATIPDAKHLFLSGWTSVVPGTRVAASVGINRDVVNPLGPVLTVVSGDGLGIQLGVFHDIVPSFTVHAGVAKFDTKDNDIAGPGATADNSEIIAIGASYKFDLGFGGSTAAK